MDLGISQLLAVALTISQVFTKPPEQFIERFDPVADQEKVVATFRDGCTFLVNEFGVNQPGTQPINLDEVVMLITMTGTSMKEEAAKIPAGQPKDAMLKLAERIDFDALGAAYREFCKGEKPEQNSALNLEEVIKIFNETMKDLPDHTKLKGLQLPGASTILDRDGNRFTEIYSDNGRRRFVPITQLPPYLKYAFVAAEDQNFFKHKGVDIRGIIRAMMANFQGGRPQGGSTITQQVVKNLLVGDSITPERKMREIVLAARLETLLSKDEILELYMNYVFMGRASWGVEMAARSYFGISARDLSIPQAAFIAGLTRGPNAYNPDRVPKLAKERLQYVIGRMKEDGYLKDEDIDEESKKFIASADPLPIIAFETPRQRAAYYFMDEIQRDAKAKTNIESLTIGSYTVRSTLHPELQKAAELALANGLTKYEAMSGRAVFTGPSGNIEAQMDKTGATWQEVMATARGDLYDIRWPAAVYLGNTLQTKDGKVFKTKDHKIGLADGRVITLKASANAIKKLKVYDLIYVTVKEDAKNPVGTLMVPPQVQGAVIVMEAKTGRVLAMSGGFSYAASQLNRVTRSARQPGSTLKPFIYLSALNLGYQPNTLIPNSGFSLPPLERGAKYWSPKNYDGGGGGVVTIRTAIEKSLNLPTARIMATMAPSPTQGLDYIRGITNELGIYPNPERVYPFVLGSQPARLIDMAVAYATIANVSAPVSPTCPMCMKPTPHFFDSIEQDGNIVYRRQRSGEASNPNNLAVSESGLVEVPSLDRVAIYQLRRILEGTLARGTATAMKDLAGVVAGKTGTSNNENDAWFMGFTNDLVVGVWVGYDSKNIRPSLGGGYTGGRVALPIAREIFDKSFEVYRAKEPLSPLPPDIQDRAVEYPIDVKSGEFNRGKFLEVFRLGGNNGPLNTQRRILRNGEYGMLMTGPMGEEENQYETQFLNPDEQYDPFQLPNPEGYQQYQPGWDDYQFRGLY